MAPSRRQRQIAARAAAISRNEQHTTIVHEETEQFSGPLPHPEMLARYEEICPGFAERSLAMVERQSEHRQVIEKKIITSKINHEATGQWMAFILSLVLFGFGGAALLLHQVSTGAWLIGSDAVTVIGMFVYRQIREERRRKEGVPPMLPDS